LRAGPLNADDAPARPKIRDRFVEVSDWPARGRRCVPRCQSLGPTPRALRLLRWKKNNSLLSWVFVCLESLWRNLALSIELSHEQRLAATSATTTTTTTFSLHNSHHSEIPLPCPPPKVLGRGYVPDSFPSEPKRGVGEVPPLLR